MSGSGGEKAQVTEVAAQNRDVVAARCSSPVQQRAIPTESEQHIQPIEVVRDRRPGQYRVTLSVRERGYFLGQKQLQPESIGACPQRPESPGEGGVLGMSMYADSHLSVSC
jgi:hypothetical protein